MICRLETEINIAALQTEIDGLETQLVKTREEIYHFLKELGYASK